MQSHLMDIATLALVSALLVIGCGGDGSNDTEGGDASIATDTGTPDANAEGGDTAADTVVVPDVDDTPTDPKCGIPDGLACNALCHTGCAEGESCVLVEAGWACHPTGFGGPETPCGNSTQCKEGVCAGFEGANATCLEPCLDAEDCDLGGQCEFEVEGANPFKFCGTASDTCVLLEAGVCEVGQVCYPNGAGTACKNPGEQAADAPCNQESDCLPNHTCVSAAGQQVCARMCSLKGSASGTPLGCDTLCGVGNFMSDDDDLKLLKIGYCYPDVEVDNCNPLSQDCGAGQGCYLSNEGWICSQAGSAEAGESCQYVGDCQAGLFCLNGKCKIICNPNGNNEGVCKNFDTPCTPYTGGAGYCDQ